MFRNLSEIWRYRSLIWALVCRHLSARYRGSILGFVWSFLNPLCLIAVYALVFKYYIRFNDVQNYTLFLFAGLLPWIWFSSGLLEATGAISGGGHLVTKAMFPPHVLPIVSVLTNLMNFLFALPLLVAFMLISGIMPTISFLILPLVILTELIFLTGLGLAFSALNVHFRDIQHILGNFITFWFFLCPIIYPPENVPERFRFTLFLNPIAVFTDMYHKVIVKGVLPEPRMLFFALSVALLTFVGGNIIFNRYREDFAEMV